MPAATQRDPRSIVTPDAFEVSPELVGTPLASPGRRAVALAVDGLVIVFITGLTRSVPLLIGVAAAALFMRAAFKRTPVRGSVFSRAMRLSVGCLGIFIALVTAALWASFGIDFNRDEPARVARSAGEGILTGLEALQELEVAESREEALFAAAGLLDAAAELGLEDDVVGEALAALAPESASWAEEWPAAVDSLLRSRSGSADASDALAEVGSPLEVLSDGEVLGAWLDLSVRDDLDASEQERFDALDARARALVAGDTLAELERRVEALRADARRTERALDEAEERIEAAENRGVFQRLLDFAEDLGFGFGWAAIYMTVILSWWRGQTVGKRLLGIRVVRLDGEPITWWVAFERVGGYAAGVATGLLGFAQVWWDANRQTIHDRIVGTVVIREGADKVLDWESAL